MNSNAAGTELIAVQHEVVALRAHFPWRSFEIFQILVHDSGERMLRADPRFVRWTPLKKGKASDPEKFPLRLINRTQSLAKIKPQLSCNQCGSFSALDFFLRRNCDDKITRFCGASFGKLFDVFRAD